MQGFAHHVGSEHNMWDYIYFSLELDRIDSSDQNAIQLFVYHQVWHSTVMNKTTAFLVMQYHTYFCAHAVCYDEQFIVNVNNIHVRF